MRSACLLLFLFCTVFYLHSLAQAPLQFNYQGVARYTGGDAIASKTIGLRFTIHSSTATGTTEYAESRTTITDARGLFNVAIGGLGATNVTGIFANISWSSGNKFLQIELDVNNNNSFINMGTTQLLSVPYSLHSNSSAFATNSLTSSSSNYSINSGKATSSISSGSYFFDAHISPGTDIKLPPNGWQTVIFDTKNFDDSSAYNTQTGGFTAKEDGIYKFDVNLYAFTLNAANGGFFKNGVLVKYFSPGKSPDNDNTDGWGGYFFNCISIVKLTAGDIITFAVHTNKNDSEAYILRDLTGAPFTTESIDSFTGYKIQ